MKKYKKGSTLVRWYAGSLVHLHYFNITEAHKENLYLYRYYIYILYIL